MTKHGPQAADSEIGKSVFESKNKSLSSDLFLERRLKTAKHKFQYIFKDILGHDIPDFPRQPYENEF